MATFINIVRRHYISIILVTLATLVLSLDVALLRPFEYKSQFSVLVMEKADNLDAYAAAKSSEKMSLSLGQVIYTTAFYDDVLDTGIVNSDILDAEDEKERREEWKNMIETRILADVGFLRIAAYHQDRAAAESVANAVSSVLVERGAEYLGGGKTILLRVVDSPLTSNKPVRPNILMSVVFGIIIGFVASTGFYIMRETRLQQKRKLRTQSSDRNPVHNDLDENITYGE